MIRAPAFAVVLLAGVVAGCDNKQASIAAPPPPSVTVSQPLQKTITEWDEYTGRFEALATVDVRARVSGFIDSIHFNDGQIVKQGDLLFVIDPRPYRLAVEQAKADVERAQSKLEIATSDVERATPLARNQTLTAREFDTRKSVQRDAAGAVGSAEATLKQAELNLEWTEVHAPIAGRISDKRVDAGNLITGGTTGTTLLTSIVTLDPIHFVFDASALGFYLSQVTRPVGAAERLRSRHVKTWAVLLTLWPLLLLAILGAATLLVERRAGKVLVHDGARPGIARHFEIRRAARQNPCFAVGGKVGYRVARLGGGLCRRQSDRTIQSGVNR